MIFFKHLTELVKCHVSTNFIVFHYPAIIYKSLHGDMFLKKKKGISPSVRTDLKIGRHGRGVPRQIITKMESRD